MAIKVFTVDRDEVIQSDFITGKTNYDFALKEFIPLIDRLDIQRKGQNPKFYTRLEDDILNGCIMPPITLAFVGLSLGQLSIKEVEEKISTEIGSAFILDGLQRMRTLQRASKHLDKTLDLARPVFINILLCDSMDKLLYRMITLNNGQKPMTARHQIEIVAGNIYDFSDSSLPVQKEKKAKKSIPGAFKQVDFIKGYLAFLSKSINVDNTKIIEEKMDELIADKILESDISDHTIEFSEVMDLIDRFTKENKELKRWFQNVNNLIGFTSSISANYSLISTLTSDEFGELIQTFESSFEYFDVSKIRVGDVRRKTVSFFIKKFEDLKKLSVSDLIDILSQEI